MNRLHTISISAAAVLALAFASCSTAQYRVASVERSRILIDSRYDNSTDPEVVRTNNALLERKKLVDAEMNPVQGHAAENLWVKRPESPLSNLLADILVWGGAKFNEQPDFAVYNMGGIRAALPEGDVTVGDVLDTAPFENKIMFLTLTGAKVKELFAQIAARKGEGVSAGVKLRITRDGQLLGAEVGGRPVDDNATYRIATLDYLAQGNDGLVAFKSKTDCKSPGGAENTVRNLIMDYFREAAAKGQAVDSGKDGRITVE